MPIQYNNRMRLQLHLKVVRLGKVLLGFKCLLARVYSKGQGEELRV
jgi:hypothetical protein